MRCCIDNVWYNRVVGVFCFCCFFVQAEDGIRDLVRSRGLGDVYKRQVKWYKVDESIGVYPVGVNENGTKSEYAGNVNSKGCLLYTSDAADERSSVDLGGSRIIKKKKKVDNDIVGLRTHAKS